MSRDSVLDLAQSPCSTAAGGVDGAASTSLLELTALRRELLGVPVDVVPARSPRPEVAAEIESDASRL
ncbi:MAG: hypothetical protein ACRDTG_23750 [Pseudonocardiaceae bacterium]